MQQNMCMSIDLGQKEGKLFSVSKRWKIISMCWLQIFAHIIEKNENGGQQEIRNDGSTYARPTR